jgi:RHS repeat-associated protein
VVTDNAGKIVNQADYTYDVFDRRISKAVDSDGAGSAIATVEQFVYDGDNIALVFDGNGSLTSRYFYGTGVDQILAEEKATGAVLWALSDNQGTVRDLIDSSGTVLNHITYDSYGNVTSESNNAVDFRFGYTGREWDAETGQYYYRARYYDPKVGEFISSDPMGFAAGDANLSRYVGNSPTNRTDPTGKDYYDTLNSVDQFAAGFGNAVTFGGTSLIREKLYGESATRNHSGALYNAGQVAGTAASFAAGFGAAGNAARGGAWAIKAAEAYTVVGDAVGAYQSTKHLVEGCFTPADLLGFAPVAGYLGGRALKGLDDTPVCFVAGTKVLTPVGEKPIEELQVGEWVVACNPELGVVENCRILQQFERESSIVLDLLVDGETITCTPEHPFWVPERGWVEAEALQVGTQLMIVVKKPGIIYSVLRKKVNLEMEK